MVPAARQYLQLHLYMFETTFETDSGSDMHDLPVEQFQARCFSRRQNRPADRLHWTTFDRHLVLQQSTTTLALAILWTVAEAVSKWILVEAWRQESAVQHFGFLNLEMWCFGGFWCKKCMEEDGKMGTFEKWGPLAPHGSTTAANKLQATFRRQLKHTFHMSSAFEVILQLNALHKVLTYLLTKLPIDTFSGGVVCLEVVVDAGVWIAVLERHYGQFGIDAM